MRLRRVQVGEAQRVCAEDEVCRATANVLGCSRSMAYPLVLLCCILGAADRAFAQQARMVIDGAIRSDGVRLPATTKVRILRADSSVDRTVQFYDPQGYRFGVRLSSDDGFAQDERILFRVVTPQDSFLARVVGGPLVFKGTQEPETAPTTKVALFRNSLPIVYRVLHDTAVNEKQLLRSIFVAIDPDGDSVRYGLSGAPAGASVDAQTGMFSWTPSYDQAGVYRVRFPISDGYDTDNSHGAIITVKNVDRPPQFIREMPDTTIKEGDTLRYTVLAEDPDGDRLTYRILGMGIPGLEVDSSGGEIRWIPTYEQAGNYRIRCLATDGTLADTTGWNAISVLNVDRPPKFISALSDTTICEDQDLRYQFAGADPDGDSVWYSLEHGPAGMGVTPSGTLEWKPSFFQAGTYRIPISLHAQSLTVDTVANVRVLNNDRPPQAFVLLQPTQNDTIGVVLSNPVQFTWAKAFDPDWDDTLRYTLHLWGPKLDTVIHIQTDTAVLISIKPLLAPHSLYYWNVTVNDGHLSATSLDTFSFRTSAGISSSAEFLSITPKNFDLEQTYPDPFNPLTTIEYSLPERSYVKLTIFNMLGESVLVLVAGEKDAGTYDVTFDASDFVSGAYMFRLDAHPLAGNQSRDYVNTKKMFIVR